MSRGLHRTDNTGIRRNDRYDGGDYGKSALCPCDHDSGDQTEATESVHHQEFLGLDLGFSRKIPEEGGRKQERL